MIEFIKLYDKLDENKFVCAIENAREVCIAKTINGDYGLTFKLHPGDEVYQQLENERICKVSGQMYRIKLVEGENVTCDHIYTDAARCHVQSTSSADLVGQNAYYLMQQIFSKPEVYGFVHLMSPEEVEELGMEWVPENMDLFIQSKVTPVAALKALMENYDKYKIHTELYVNNRDIALVKQIGKDTDIHISLRCNAKSMSSSKDSSELITRLYPYGKDDLHIGSVEENGNQYIDSPDIDSLGIYEGFMQFDNIDDPNELYEAGLKQFEENNPDRIDRCKYTITVDAALFDENIGLGDTVIVEDDDFKCITRQRVVGLEIYPFEPNRNKVTIGTPPITVEETFSGLINNSVKTEVNTNNKGEIKTGWLEMMQHNEKVSIDEAIQNEDIAVYKTGALFESEDGTKPAAVAIINGKLAIASGRDDNGNWIWTTIMDSGKVVLGEAFTGALYTNIVKILSEKGEDTDPSLTIENKLITISDGKYDRVKIGYDEDGTYRFELRDKDGNETFLADDDGNLTLKGAVEAGNEEGGKVVINDGGIKCYKNGKLNGLVVDPSDSAGKVELYVNGNNALCLFYSNDQLVLAQRKGEEYTYIMTITDFGSLFDENGTPDLKMHLYQDVSIDGDLSIDAKYMSKIKMKIDDNEIVQISCFEPLGMPSMNVSVNGKDAMTIFDPGRDSDGEELPPYIVFDGDIMFKGDVNFEEATVSGVKDHNHGVPDGTWLSTADGGTVEFNASSSI